MAITTHLQSHEVFACLSPTELVDVVAIAEYLHHDKNEVIYTIDQEEGFLHYILTGSFEVRPSNNTQI